MSTYQCFYQVSLKFKGNGELNQDSALGPDSPVVHSQKKTPVVFKNAPDESEQNLNLVKPSFLSMSFHYLGIKIQKRI